MTNTINTNEHVTTDTELLGFPRIVHHDTRRLYRFRATTFKTRNNVCVTMPREKRSRESGNRLYLPVGASVFDVRDCSKTVPFTMHDGVWKPHVPASSLKGAWRNCAAEVVTQGQEGLLHHEAIGMLAVGGSIGKNEYNFSIEQMKHLDKGHPLLAVFGYNNPSFGQGFTAFSNAIPKDEFKLTCMKTVRKLRHKEESFIKFINPETISDYEEAIQKQMEDSDKKRELEAHLEALKEEIKNASNLDKEILQREINDTQKEIDEGDFSVNSGQIHYDWAIPAGIDFDLDFRNSMNRVELGFFLRVLKRWGMCGSLIGGKRSYGAGGNFQFQFAVSVLDIDDITGDEDWRDIGTICNYTEINKKVECSDKVFIDGDELTESMKAFAASFLEIKNLNLTLENYTAKGKIETKKGRIKTAAKIAVESDPTDVQE